MEPIRTPSLAFERAQPGAETSIPLGHYFWVFRRNALRIGIIVAVATLLALVISLRLTPLYEATVAIDVDRQSPTGVIGQESSRGFNNDADQYLATQVKMLQSDSVLRPVVERFKLPVRKPSRFRLIRAYTEQQKNDAPMVLEGLKVSRPPNTYLLNVTYKSSDPKLGRIRSMPSLTLIWITPTTSGISPPWAYRDSWKSNWMS